MSINYAQLVSQGRAKALGVCWSPEELEALITLERERGLSRLRAADYIRNGIMTPADFDKAEKAKFTPKTREEAEAEVDATLKAHGQEVVAEAAPAVPETTKPRAKKKV